MKDIPDKSIDMILCDLPYGTTRNKWDSVISFAELWGGYNRIIKENGAVVLFSQMPFTVALVNSNQKMFRYEWIWQKPQGSGFLNSHKMPLKAHENVCVFYKKSPTYNPQMKPGKPYSGKVSERNLSSTNYGDAKVRTPLAVNYEGRFPTDVIEFQRDAKGLHPTQKPVALLEYLIKTYTNEGETVLDNCMGSGSTGVACINTGRNFIGMELDEMYFSIAKERIENAEQQKRTSE